MLRVGPSKLSAVWGHARCSPQVFTLGVHTCGGTLDVHARCSPQVHSATLDSGVLERREVIERLAQLRDAGVLIGLTLTGPGQGETLAAARRVIVGGRPLFGCVQATFNLLEGSAGPALAAARDAGLGVIIKEAMANGRLAPRRRGAAAPPGGASPGATPQLEVAPAGMSPEAAAPLAREAAALGATSDALALAYVMAQPWVDVVLSGASTREQLAANARGVALAAALDARALRRLSAAAEAPKAYWEQRSALAWN